MNPAEVTGRLGFRGEPGRLECVDVCKRVCKGDLKAVDF